MPQVSEGRDAIRPGACRVLIMAALPLEVRPFLRQMGARPRRDLEVPAWEFEPGPGVAAVSGMGEVAAREAGESLVERCRPEILVSLGFGGALTPGLQPGDLALGGTFWRYNPDNRELRAGPQPAAPRPLPGLCGALAQAGLNAVAGSLITTSRIIHKGRQGGPLWDLPQPVLDLETVALAEISADRGVAFLGLRAITDAAGEEIPEFLWGAGEPGTTVGVGAALRWLAVDVRRVKELLHLWRRSRLAARNLGAGLTVLWPLLLAAGKEL